MAFPHVGGPGVALNLTGAIGALQPQAPGVFTSPAQGSNAVTLQASQVLLLPANTWFIAPGPYTCLQWLDPAANQWRTVNADTSLQPIVVDSDGGNWRLANLTGCPVGALITNAGAAATYTNGIGTTATGCTITPSAGNSIWVPVCGGAINSTITITAAGANYIFPPTLVISAPPAGGVQATATCTISGGAIATVTVLNQGAGYRSIPTITVINDYRDTAGSGATLTVASPLVGSGTLTAMYPSPLTVASGTTGGNGTVLTAAPTFTFSPASTTAATAVMNWVVTSLGVTAVGSGGTGFSNPTTAMVINNALVAGTRAANVAGPIADINLTQPRPAFIQVALSSGVLNTTGHIIIDNGFGFQQVPLVNIIAPPNSILGATVTANVGGVSDTSYVQPM